MQVGAAISMTYVTGQPIVFVGTGQTYRDLRNLNADAVVRSLLKWLIDDDCLPIENWMQSELERREEKKGMWFCGVFWLGNCFFVVGVFWILYRKIGDGIFGVFFYGFLL